MPKLKWIEPSEREIQNAILHCLSYQKDVFAFEITTSARWDPILRCYRKLGKYVRPGTSDILLCVKVRSIGVFVAMEVKTQKGRQSPDQKVFQIMVESFGGYYFVIRSVKDAEEALAKVRNDVGH